MGKNNNKKKDKKAMKDKAPKPVPAPVPPSVPGIIKFQVPGVKYESSGKIHWSNPVLFIITLGCMILAAYLVKERVVALLAKDTIISNVGKVVKFFKGKDP